MKFLLIIAICILTTLHLASLLVADPGRGHSKPAPSGVANASDSDQPAGKHGQAKGHGGAATGQAGRGVGKGHGQAAGANSSETDETAKGLGKIKNRFVGHIHPHGNNKENKTKPGKAKKQKNPKVIVWNGVAKVTKGLSADDKPKPVGLPPDIAQLPKFGRPCIHGKQYQPLQPTAESGGPKVEGFTVNDFKPCLERRRGRKQSSDAAAQNESLPAIPQEGANVEQAHKKSNASRSRKKRSESYSILALLWKDPSKIPYAFDRSLPSQYVANVRKAINFWQSNTCLRFVEKSSSAGINEPFILFTLGAEGCSTNRLGPNTRAPYSTVIDIGTCENLVGSIAHEIGHAMGLAHSQKRVDRDRSVRLYFQNIDRSWHPQFERDQYQYFDPWGVPYYYDSLMHYFPYAATINGKMTICPLDPLMELVMGQREEPAFGDISLMNRIYCQESCFARAQLKGMQFYGNKSMTISGRTCQNWAQQSPTRHRFTSLGNHSSCRNPDNWEGGPWCFTTDPQVRMEPCFSPCEDLAATNRPRCQGWCYNGGYNHPSTCACVCPRWATGRNCETVNKQALYSSVTMGCGGKIDLRSGQKVPITSPSYPSSYPINKGCMWWIQSPSNTRVKISVQDFQVETADASGCYDYLEVRPSICAAAVEPVEKMRFCGNALAPYAGRERELFSDDNNMVLKFFSDETQAAKGFKLTAEIASFASG